MTILSFFFKKYTNKFMLLFLVPLQALPVILMRFPMKNINTISLLSLVALGSACGEVPAEKHDTNEVLESTVEETILPNVSQPLKQTSAHVPTFSEHVPNSYQTHVKSQ